MHAQQAVGADLPDAPTPEPVVVASGGATPSAHSDPQTKRILGIFPNFRAVSAEAHLPPQSVEDKFETASRDSLDYSALVLPAALAGYSEMTNATPEFRSGWPGYERYFWHTWVDQTSENYMVEFIVPALAREDTRYYTMGPGGGRKLRRMGYALSRAVVTRNDAGKETFNVSEVVGAGAAAGISNFYYPRQERTFAKTADKWSVNIGVDAAGSMIREFWPDINHFLFHGNVPMANH
ncbi:MAG: hypothetical protein ABSG84_03655 [Acidobacteriaceae bacterium]